MTYRADVRRTDGQVRNFETFHPIDVQLRVHYAALLAGLHGTRPKLVGYISQVSTAFRRTALTECQAEITVDQSVNTSSRMVGIDKALTALLKHRVNRAVVLRAVHQIGSIDLNRHRADWREGRGTVCWETGVVRRVFPAEEGHASAILAQPLVQIAHRRQVCTPTSHRVRVMRSDTTSTIPRQEDVRAEHARV